MPALQTEPRAHHYKLIGLEIAPRDAQAFLYDVVLLGTTGPDQDRFPGISTVPATRAPTGR